MTFKKNAQLALLATIALVISGNTFAATFEVALGDARGRIQWELATKFKKSFEENTADKHKVDRFRNFTVS